MAQAELVAEVSSRCESGNLAERHDQHYLTTQQQGCCRRRRRHLKSDALREGRCWEDASVEGKVTKTRINRVRHCKAGAEVRLREGKVMGAIQL